MTPTPLPTPTLVPPVPSFNPHPFVLRTPKVQTVQQVTLPHLFTPRTYQEEDLFRQLFPHHYPDLRMLSVERKKRIVLLWHRRAGKDLSSVSALTLAAYEELGNYLYLLPEQTQAKKVIWRGIDKDGIAFTARVPEQIIKKRFESEMLIELINGSTLQFGGADTYNSWMGTNPKGIIFSEYSLQDPMAWLYFRPILVENGGWAVFIYTARGKNHGYDLYNTAKANPETWHHSRKTIEDTERAPGVPVVTQQQYLQEIEEGMLEAFARQEFYCDFEAALIGSYYGDLIAKARETKRIGFFPHDPGKPVYTSWDLGNDANVVIFAQATEGGDPRIIDHIHEPDTKFSEVCKMVLEKSYTYESHFAPHDIKNRDHETNTRLNTAEKLGINFVVTPRGSRNDGIEAVRQLLPRTQFHEVDTERLINALSSYHRVYDDKLKTYREQPVHDWSSHDSDAFRILAVNWTPDMLDDTWLQGDLQVNVDWIV